MQLFGITDCEDWVQEGQLLDMYARSDITMLARGNSYSRLQWEDMTVGQALDLPYAPDHASRPNNGGQSPGQSRRHSPRQSSELVRHSSTQSSQHPAKFDQSSDPLTHSVEAHLYCNQRVSRAVNYILISSTETDNVQNPKCVH